MRFEDERYVRIYTRDTLTWLRLEWQGQAVLSLLFRKVDRAGLLAIDDEDPVEALATVLRMPTDVVAYGWAKLTIGKDPVVTLRDKPSRAIFVPKFLEAQEANQSDPARKRKSREMAAARVLVTPCDHESQIVTKSHTRSHAVTPSCAVPNCTDQRTTTSPPALPEKPEAPAVAKAAEQVSLMPASPFVAYCLGEWKDQVHRGKLEVLERAVRSACPGVDPLSQAKLARLWEVENPTKVRPHKVRFLGRWMRTAQERVGLPPRPGAHVPHQNSDRTPGRKVL